MSDRWFRVWFPAFCCISSWLFGYIAGMAGENKALVESEQKVRAQQHQISELQMKLWAQLVSRPHTTVPWQPPPIPKAGEVRPEDFIPPPGVPER